MRTAACSAPAPCVVALLTKSEPAPTFLGNKSEPVGILHRIAIYFHADRSAAMEQFIRESRRQALGVKMLEGPSDDGVYRLKTKPLEATRMC